MLKKILVSLSLAFILTACARFDESSLAINIENVLSTAQDMHYQVNNSLPDFSYYLPSSMSQDDADNDVVCLKYSNSSLIMSLNISGMVTSHYYPDKYLKDDGFFRNDYLLYEKKGQLNNDQVSKDFVYKLYKIDDTYLLHFYSPELNFYGWVDKFDVIDLTSQISTIILNCEVDQDKIIAAYSDKDVISYRKHQIDLFDSSVLSDGALADILVDDAVVGDGGIKEPVEE